MYILIESLSIKFNFLSNREGGRVLYADYFEKAAKDLEKSTGSFFKLTASEELSFGCIQVTHLEKSTGSLFKSPNGSWMHPNDKTTSLHVHNKPKEEE